MKTFLIGSLFLFSISVQAQLTYTLTSDTIALCYTTGISGECNLDVYNSSDSTLQLNIKRIEQVGSSPWLSGGICTSVLCYPISVDSASVDIPPGGTEEVKIFFQYLAPVSDTARALITFWNDQNSSNRFTQNFFGVSTTGTLGTKPPVENGSVLIYPHPMIEYSTVQFPENMNQERITLVDVHGRTVKTFNVNGESFTLYREGLPKGIYFLHFSSSTYRTQRLVVQ